MHLLVTMTAINFLLIQLALESALPNLNSFFSSIFCQKNYKFSNSMLICSVSKELCCCKLRNLGMQKETTTATTTDLLNIIEFLKYYTLFWIWLTIHLVLLYFFSIFVLHVSYIKHIEGIVNLP